MPTATARPAAPAEASAAPAVQAIRLGKAYPQGREQLKVLRDIDLTVARGEFLSIMGPSGSGKSTLLNLVGLLDAPTSGTLRLMGRDVSRLSAGQAALARRDNLGFIFQSFNLMPRLTALQNVILPLAIADVPRASRLARGQQLLAAVGLSDRARHRPAELSGGQKQRVAIARALALDPPILLADEPTGNLDTRTGEEILQLFVRLHRAGKTIIQVTHDAHVASFSSRVVHFRDGAIERTEARTPAPAPRSLAPTRLIRAPGAP
ncbi:MAG TPA: ABC transporter ATP-binding protein [Candidatus Thermoplasmatota archaeon]|nr:ABC transporter ATP-binding protein [Candidatus Thermoplasmatota archaeon]